MAGTKTLYNSTALECALELLWRTHGLQINRDYALCSIAPIDAQNARLSVVARNSPRDNSPSIYAGQTSYDYKKFPLETILPADLVYDGEYPLTFERLQQFLKFSYDFWMEAEEFAIDRNGVIEAPLGAGDTIGGALQSGDYLVLSTTMQSGRWIEGSKLRLKVIPFAG